MSLPLINTPDSFEMVRDAVANILAAESISQIAAANAWNIANPTEEQLDTTEWALSVYTERSNSFELYRDSDNNNEQIVNVWFENSSFDSGKSTQARAWVNSTINIDCIACSVTAEGVDGQEPGDESAARRAQKMARLCRRILMNPEYRSLGLTKIVSKRDIPVRTMSPKGGEQPFSKHIDGVQLQLNVQHLEFFDFEELSASEGALITIYREPDGPVIAQMDYDWTV